MTTPLSAAGGDTLVLLRCQPGLAATKRHTRQPDGTWQTEGYSAGALFDAYTRPVSCVMDLAVLLAKAARDPRTLVIRGRLTRGRAQARGVLRRYLGYGSDFERADRRWLAIDLDSAPAPAWLEPEDPDSLQAAVRHAVLSHLPEPFHGARCFYRWSASAGVKPWSELRLQLWYWLARPACDPSLREWMRATDAGAPRWPYIDASLYQPVQPHYVATPLFAGADDPLGEHRAGMLRGREAVELPGEVVDLAAWQRGEAEAAASRRQQAAAHTPTTPPDTSSFAAGALRAAVARIRNAQEGGRHAAVFASAAWLGGHVAAGLLDESVARAELEAAAMAVLPEDRHAEARRTVAEGLTRGAHDPTDTRTIRQPGHRRQGAA